MTEAKFDWLGRGIVVQRGQIELWPLDRNHSGKKKSLDSVIQPWLFVLFGDRARLWLAE